MKKKRLYIIIGFVCMLIIGLIGVQLHWIRNTYRLQEISFNEKVSSALKAIGTGIDKKIFSFNLYTRAYIQPGQGIMVLKRTPGKSVSDTLPLFNIFPYPDKPDTCFYSTSISYYDVLTMVDVTMRFEFPKEDSQLNSVKVNDQIRSLTLNNYRGVLDDTALVLKRWNMINVDSIIKEALNKEGINSAYSYGIKRKGADNYLVASDKAALDKADSKHTVTIFSDKGLATPYLLTLIVNNKEKINRNILNSSLLISCIVIIGLTLAFIYFFRTVLQQKKLSEMKTDFINNMTHEFMTPVTNIGLALETLEKNKGKNNDYTERVMQVISTENLLLKDNILKVLQVAVLEKGSFLLDVTTIQIHDLLRKTADSFTLQLQREGGKIIFHFEAIYHTVNADETHLTNLFYNIVDNAIKYAADRPLVIDIFTSNTNGKLKVVIKDNGIGMNVELQRNAFSKFYRGRQNNVHDVKGFGLGLSYVKSIAEAHNLDISLSSIAGQGTSFTIWFDLK